MKAVLLLALCVAAFAAPIPLASVITHYALLDGDSQAPPLDSQYKGIAIFSLSGSTIAYTIIHNIPANIIAGAHIHSPAYPGETGAIAVNIAVSGATSPLTGSIAIGSTTAATLSNGQAYLNIHSSVNANGEIRGQILAAGQATITALGEYSIPAVNSTAYAAGFFTNNATSVAWRVFHNVVNVTQIHLHGPATASQTAAVEVTLASNSTEATSPLSGSSTVTAASVSDFKKSLQYLNVHTSLYAGGEVRGQLQWGNVQYAVGLDGPQAAGTGSNSTGLGAGIISISGDGSVLEAYVQATGLQGTITAIHIHGPAPVGTAAGVLATLVTGNPSLTLAVSSSTFYQYLNSGQAYFNVHTTAFTNGEIRGQIAPIGTSVTSLNPTGSATGATASATTAASTTGAAGVASPIFALTLLAMAVLLF